MKKIILTLVLVCSASFGFAQSVNDSTNVRAAFVNDNGSANGVTYDFNKATAKMEQLNQSIENHKQQIEANKQAIATLKEEVKKAKEAIVNATNVTIAK